MAAPGTRPPSFPALRPIFSRPARAVLEPTGSGSRLQYNATVEVHIPLVGGKLETFIGGKLAELVGAEQRFTSAWIAGH